MISDIETKAPADLFTDSIKRATSRHLSIVDLINCAEMLASID